MSDSKEKRKGRLPRLIQTWNATVVTGIAIGMIGLGLALGFLAPRMFEIRVGLGLITLTPMPFHHATYTLAPSPTLTPSATRTPAPTATHTSTPTPTPVPFDDATSGIVMWDFNDTGTSNAVRDKLIETLNQADAPVGLIPYANDNNATEPEQRNQALATMADQNATVAIWGSDLVSPTWVYVDVQFDETPEIIEGHTQPIVPIPSDLSDLAITPNSDADVEFISYYVLGHLYYAQGDYRSAIAAFDQAESRIPLGKELTYSADAVFFYRALSRWQLGEINELIAELEQVIAIDSTIPAAYYYIGRLHAYNEEYIEAIKHFDLAVDYGAAFTLAYYHRGLTWANAGNLDTAIQDLTRAIDFDRFFKQAYITRSDVWLLMGNTTGAFSDYETIMNLYPEDFYIYTVRGLTYVDLREPELAKVDFDFAIANNPLDAAAFTGRGKLYYDVGDWDSALADLQQAINLHPDYPEPYYYLGQILLSQSSHQDVETLQEALTYFDIAIDMGMTDAYVFRSVTHFNLRNFTYALADFAKYEVLVEPLPEIYQPVWDEIKRVIDNNSFIWAQGLAKMDVEAYEQAIPHFDDYITRNPNRAEGYFQRGLAYHHSFQSNLALLDLDRAIQLDPENPEAYFWRGRATLSYPAEDSTSQSRALEAVEFYSTAIELDPSYADALYHRAVEYWRLGTTGRDRMPSYIPLAIDDLTHLINLGNTQYYITRGAVYMDMLDYENALSDIEAHVASGGRLTPHTRDMQRRAMTALGLIAPEVNR